MENRTLLVLRTVALVLLFIKFYYYDPVLAPNHDYCADSRLLSSENGPVIQYAKCESGFYCALNRELLCRLYGTNQLLSTHAC